MSAVTLAQQRSRLAIHGSAMKSLQLGSLVQVYGLPTLVLFKDGEVVKGSQKEGALGKPVILKYLETYGLVLPQTAQ